MFIPAVPAQPPQDVICFDDVIQGILGKAAEVLFKRCMTSRFLCMCFPKNVPVPKCVSAKFELCSHVTR